MRFRSRGAWFSLFSVIDCYTNVHGQIREKAHKKTKGKKDKAAKPKVRKPNAAFMKPVQPDEKLAAVVGAKPLPRTELTKKLWEYIKKHKLQDPKKKTQINADANLKAVFSGKKTVSMFEMTKLVSRRLGGPGPGAAAGPGPG